MPKKRKARRPGNKRPNAARPALAAGRQRRGWLLALVVIGGLGALALTMVLVWLAWGGDSPAPDELATSEPQVTRRAPGSLAKSAKTKGAPGTAEQPRSSEAQSVADSTTPADAADLNGSFSELTDEQRDQALRTEQIEAANSLAREFPHDHNAVYLVGLVHQEQGNFDQALDNWNRCRQLNATRPDLYNSMGQAFVMKADLDAAAEMFRKALSLQSNLMDARIRLAETLMLQGKVEEVVATLEANLGSIPKACLLLGQAYQQSNQYAKAKKTLLRAVTIDPNLPDAYYALAKVCARLKETDEAKTYHEKFRELKAQGQKQGRDWRRVYNPLEITRQSVAHTHTDVARVYRSMGKSRQAEELWRRAADLDPANTNCRMHLAMLCQRTGREAEALRIHEQLSKLQPTSGLHHFNIGNLSMLLKRYNDAEKAYRRVIELEPNRADGYRALAQCYLVASKNPNQAVLLARKALQLDPSAPVYALLGDACQRNGDTAAALQAMQQAVKMDPGNARYQRRYEALQLGR